MIRRVVLRTAAAALLALCVAAAPAQTAAPAAIKWSTVADLNAAPVDTYLFLTGTITSIKSPDPGTRQPWIVYVADGDDFARIVVLQETWAQIENPARFEKGLVIQAYGKVNDYKGIRQLVAEGPKWIRIDPNSTAVARSALRESASTVRSERATLVTVGGVGVAGIGNRLRVRGTVEAVEPPSNPRTPTKLTLRDATGTIKVVYWGEVASTLPASHAPFEGAEMEASGILQEYRGEFQLRVDAAEDLLRPKSISRAGN